MTQDHGASDEKRQAILQRLRDRRGEGRRANLNQSTPDEQDESSRRPLRRQRNQQPPADLAPSLDDGDEQGLELGADDRFVEDFLSLRRERRSKRAGAKWAERELEVGPSSASEPNSEDRIVEAFLRLRDEKKGGRARANRAGGGSDQAAMRERRGPGRRRRELDPEQASSMDFVRNMRQFLGGVEADLSVIPLAELEQRRQELRYRYGWLQSLLSEMQEELDRLQDHLISRLQSRQQTQEDSSPD